MSFPDRPTPELPVAGEMIADDRFEIAHRMASNEFQQRYVYAATDTLLDMPVALKLAYLRSRAVPTTADFMQFDREVHAVEDVAHPNVIESLGSGVLTDRGGVEAFFLAAPLANQGNLSGSRHNVTDRKSAQSAWGILVDAAMGLDALYTAGYTHGDVKNSHVLVHDGRGIVAGLHNVQTRFGRLKWTHPAFRFDMYQLHHKPGSIGYASPEQATAPKESFVDQRSDIFSWGVTALVALNNNRYPFSPPDSPAATPSLKASLRAMRNCEITIDFRDYIPRDVYRLLLQCVRPNSEDRPQSFAEIIEQARPMFDDDYVDGQRAETDHERRVARDRRIQKTLFAISHLGLMTPQGTAHRAYMNNKHVRKNSRGFEGFENSDTNILDPMVRQEPRARAIANRLRNQGWLEPVYPYWRDNGDGIMHSSDFEAIAHDGRPLRLDAVVSSKGPNYNSLDSSEFEELEQDWLDRLEERRDRNEKKLALDLFDKPIKRTHIPVLRQRRPFHMRGGSDRYGYAGGYRLRPVSVTRIRLTKDQQRKQKYYTLSEYHNRMTYQEAQRKEYQARVRRNSEAIGDTE